MNGTGDERRNEVKGQVLLEDKALKRLTFYILDHCVTWGKFPETGHICSFRDTYPVSWWCHNYRSVSVKDKGNVWHSKSPFFSFSGVLVPFLEGIFFFGSSSSVPRLSGTTALRNFYWQLYVQLYCEKLCQNGRRKLLLRTRKDWCLSNHDCRDFFTFPLHLQGLFSKSMHLLQMWLDAKRSR